MKNQAEHYNRMARLMGKPEIEQYTANEFAEKFFGIEPKSDFEIALDEDGVRYILTESGVVIAARDLDMRKFGNLIGGYDCNSSETVQVPYHLLK